MQKKILILSFALMIAGTLFAQKPPTTDEEYEATYDRRVRQKVLYGVYIPKDLAECFVQLNRMAPGEGKIRFSQLPEGQVPERAFYGLGRWIIHNWGFYGGSRLTVYLNQLELFHPEDMANFILIAYHRHLNKKSLDVKSLLESIRERRAELIEAEKLEGTVIHSEKRIRPKQADKEEDHR